MARVSLPAAKLCLGPAGSAQRWKRRPPAGRGAMHAEARRSRFPGASKKTAECQATRVAAFSTPDTRGAAHRGLAGRPAGKRGHFCSSGSSTVHALSHTPSLAHKEGTQTEFSLKGGEKSYHAAKKRLNPQGTQHSVSPR
ncbi:hypothetical protein MRX96_048714 [Rhipicephalus microplus]